MHTKSIMLGTSGVLGVLGLGASFAPQEIIEMVGGTATPALTVLIQLLGALYCAGALTNWFAKDSQIGGIYGRPLTVGNSVHFTMGALALARYNLTGQAQPILIVLLVVYVVLALLFGWLMFRATGLPRSARTDTP